MTNWYIIKACELADPWYGYIELVVIGTEEEIKVAVELLEADGYDVYTAEVWDVE